MTKSTDRPHLVKMSKLAKLAGVPAPTIKHYIREGLLPGPAQRTSRNMAYYDAKIADRVRVIKELQQRHFLPLRLIGEILEPPPSAQIRQDLDAETQAQLGALANGIRIGHEALVEKSSPRATRKRLSRAEVLEQLHVSEDDLKSLVELGILNEDHGMEGKEPFEGYALDLMEIIDETRRSGLGKLFPMDILKPYSSAVRNLVRVELNLFRQRVLETGLSDDLTVEQVATAAAELGQRLLLSIRSQLLLKETERLAQPWTAVPPDYISEAFDESSTWSETTDLNGYLGMGDDSDYDSVEIDIADSAVINLRRALKANDEKS